MRLKMGYRILKSLMWPTVNKNTVLAVEQFLDLKSLKGDSSDNLPGVPGIGEKTAIQLLQQYQTLDNIYVHIDEIKPTTAKKLIDGKELAYISKEVGRIWVDAPVKLDLGCGRYRGHRS